MEDVLKGDGFYQADPTKQICRKITTWDEFCEEQEWRVVTPPKPLSYRMTLTKECFHFTFWLTSRQPLVYVSLVLRGL
jgi:hypothetical protein